MKILIINSSHRAGNTDIISKELQKTLIQFNNEIRELKLRDLEMKLPDGCDVCADSGICPNIIDQFSQDIEPTIRDFDLYIILTPTYSDNITSLLKIFWDRIVSWCHEERKYLKNKKLAIVVHGMAGKKSWSIPIIWVKSISKWEEAIFCGSLTIHSGSKIGDIDINSKAIKKFVKKL